MVVPLLVNHEPLIASWGIYGSSYFWWGLVESAADEQHA
jgi:hypothetical protein